MQCSASFLEKLQVPFVKMGSGDSNNIRLQVEVARRGRPMVVSTGMSSMGQVKASPPASISWRATPAPVARKRVKPKPSMSCWPNARSSFGELAARLRWLAKNNSNNYTAVAPTAI